MCCIAMNFKKCLIMCVMIVLTRLCYVLLLSCYLGNVLVVQPFFSPTNKKIYKKMLSVLLLRRPLPSKQP
jgi:hypothetical protein